MNVHASPEEQRIAAEADTPPSFLDEKKFLEERRRRLEASLQDHVEELKDRGREVGKVALVGAGAVVGVWLLAKAVGGLTSRRKHKKARALKGHVALTALGPGTTAERPRPMAPPEPPPVRPLRSYADEEGIPRTAPATAPAEPAGPSLFQTFMESEAGRMMTNQLVAILMVFVTRKLEDLLKIERNADIGSVKESDLTPYRIVDPVTDATVVPDADDSARPNAAPTAAAS